MPSTHRILVAPMLLSRHTSLYQTRDLKQDRDRVSLEGENVYSRKGGQDGVSGLQGGEHRVMGRVTGLVGGWFNLGFTDDDDGPWAVWP